MKRRTKVSKGAKSVDLGKPKERSERKPIDDMRLSIKTVKSSSRKRVTRTTNQEKEGASDKLLDSSAKNRRQNTKVVGNYNRDKPITSDQKAKFVQFLNDTFAAGVQAILDQYHQQLKNYLPPNCTRRAFDANPDKNRYKDVMCIDNARVELKDGHPNGSYIHANLVSGEPLINSFICTQGPMTSTVVDFWRMCVQEKVENIFMLAETVEQDKPKCAQYWPRDGGKTLDFSGITVKNTDVDTSDSTTITSTLEVTYRGSKFLIKHHLWRTWPDKSVPSSVMAPFRLLRISRWSSNPTVIHCSAGIGRTGTIAVLEYCLQTLLVCKTLNVVEVIKMVRTMRMSCVQTDIQLLYIHKCLIAYATAAGLITGELNAKAAKFDNEYNDILRKAEQEQCYAPLQPTQGTIPTAGTPQTTSPNASKPSPLFL